MSSSIRYILYLIFMSTMLNAQKVDISFEVFHAQKSYLDIAQQKVEKLKRKGFNCYILNSDDEVSVRCNDSSTLQIMQENINKLQKKGIPFTIIKKETADLKEEHRQSNKLQRAYQLYNKKEYTKAYEIFSKLYKKDKKFEHAYAYSLVLMKLKKYEKALDILSQYKQDKAKLLSKDIAEAYFYKALDHENYTLANKIISKYHLNKDKRLEIPYKKALELFKNKKYAAALKILAPYKNSSVKIKKLYNDILYTKYMDMAWYNVSKNPEKAVKLFKDACKIKKEFDCYNGMMYAYYNQKKYKVSLYLAQKLYAYQADEKLAVMAYNSSMALKDYDEAKEWYSRVSIKNSLSDPNLQNYLVHIDAYIKRSELEKAKSLLSEAVVEYPKEQKLLKREMRIYAAEKRYLQAQKIAKEILYKDPKDNEAKYILALGAFEKKNYKACLSYLETINLKEMYQKNMFYQCKAYDKLRDGAVQNALSVINNVTDKKVIYAFYLDLGKFLEDKNDIKALQAYKKAKELNNESIDAQLAYLFALKKFQQDKKLQTELADAYKHFPKEKKKLDAFALMYSEEKLFQLYKNKKYEECYQYSKTIAPQYKNSNIYRLSGWCAYSMEDYKSAQKAFSAAMQKDQSDFKNLYPYALASAKLHERDSALKTLDKIDTFSSEQEKAELLQLYALLQEQNRAKEFANMIEDEEYRDENLQAINKSYTQLFYENSLSAAFYWQSQAGRDGLNSFDKYIIPVNYDYYDVKNSLHFYIDADIMYLQNEKLNTTAFKDYGLGTYMQENTLDHDSGLMPKVGVDYKNYHFMLGSTPLGSKISPELTALFSTYYTKKNWLGSFKVEQTELDETMLSFVGERAKNSTSEIYWGRVLKRGATVGLHYSSVVDLSLNLSYFPEIYGKNVQTNSEKKAVVIAMYYPAVERLDYMQLGVVGIYDSYDRNENLFTYGHGGYFSPQSFYMAGLFSEFGDHINHDLYYKAKLGVGFETYSVDDAQKFPLHDGIVNSNEIVGGYKENGLDYKAAFQLGYKIDTNFDFISGLSFESFQNYSIHEFTFGFVYRFDKHYNDYNTFYLNHRVDKIIPRYEVAK